MGTATLRRVNVAQLACALITLAIIAISTIRAEAHGQCVSFPDPVDAFKHADVVFVGMAVAGEATGVKGDHVTSHRATFRVERIWKGQTQRRLTVGADASFKVGSRYVVFAAGKPLFTTLQCKASELESDAAKKLEWLTNQPSRRPR